MPSARKPLPLLFYAGGGSLLGLFAVAYLAYWIPPEVAWWLQLLAVGLPLLVAALGGWAVLMLWQRRWIWSGGALLALVLYGLRHAPFYEVSSENARGDTLVVMTYNLPDTHQPGLGDTLLAFASHYRPQVISFQEVGVWRFIRPQRTSTVRLIHHLRPLVERQGYQFSTPDSARGPMFAEVVTMTRLPVMQQETRPLARGPEGLIYQAVRSELCWQGRRFVHYNVRLQSYGPVKPWEMLRNGHWKRLAAWRQWLGAYRKAMLQRARQVRQLRAWIAQEQLPLILSGDFNSTPDQWFYGQLAQGLRVAGRLGGVATPTWPAARPLVRIDHVLVSREWEVLEGTVPAVQLSDHRPVIARLRWRRPPTYAETCSVDAPSAHPEGSQVN
ncbi:endonuclease/exonuclease/phosphatase family protein [Rhodothermus profundi]|uniref:Metal-dependent hydrolase, endonuclease/exonuclease/phosphatase family n=1 Tax=Rhodothermus profundi TaxID=633813 RepID=A0A1M6VCT1_9BACT|nr:endonuclease/exonuclease/phosphatase family protein [Rhodothermus profundi]SHK79096.1 Metal-dependent hydrolase, endonuclease/exonuclease/phosphatase family [Rhodothermus profundi]